MARSKKFKDDDTASKNSRSNGTSNSKSTKRVKLNKDEEELNEKDIYGVPVKGSEIKLDTLAIVTENERNIAITTTDTAVLVKETKHINSPAVSYSSPRNKNEQISTETTNAINLLIGRSKNESKSPDTNMYKKKEMSPTVHRTFYSPYRSSASTGELSRLGSGKKQPSQTTKLNLFNEDWESFNKNEKKNLQN